MTQARTGRGAATREHILRTATEMFGEQGYRGASLRDIAARCSLTHPALLYHFPTKEALLMAVLERRDAIDSGAPERRGAAALRGMAALAEDNSRQRGIVELYATVSAEATSPDHPAHDYFRERYARVVSEVAQSLREAEEDGDLAADTDPDEAARILVAAWDGLQVQWLLDERQTDVPASLRRLLGHFLTS